MQPPIVGQRVMYNTNPTDPTELATAWITRVIGDHPDSGWIVNIRVLLDAVDEVPAVTDVRLFRYFDDYEAAGGAGGAYTPYG